MSSRLAGLDLGARLSKQDYRRRLRTAQDRLLHLRLHLGGQMGSGALGPALLVLFEGRDASGKGGAIKRVVESIDPRHVRVSNFSAPTYDEKRHHFLWRFYKELPGLGGMAVFDRSWYGRVLVERVEALASVSQWERAYEEIVQFEKTLVLEGMILVKFWIHISDEEQERRFHRRAAAPLKHWKLTEEDWRNRERNADYDEAADDLFDRTDHELAPWDLIAGEQKRFARVAVVETLVHRVERGMRQWGMPVPDGAELAAGRRRGPG